MLYNSHSFIEYALKQGAIKLGDFELKSGRKSRYFFNAGVFNDGQSLWELGNFYARTIAQSDIVFDVLFGPAYKGIPLVCATAVCLRQMGVNKPFAFNRKEEKYHGEGGVLVGAPLEGQRVLIVDDVITAGTAVRHSVALLNACSAKAVALIISFDRQEKGVGDSSAVAELSEQLGLAVLSVATYKDLIAVLNADERYKNFWT
ncbi:MAG: orotate phosphoribosyltransferase [Chromatiales bacterium]|nr:orotate phosphoribosyltransferase [Chromatiales bacterium]